MNSILKRLYESIEGVCAIQNSEDWKLLKMLERDGFAISGTHFGDEEIFNLTPEGARFYRSGGYR